MRTGGNLSRSALTVRQQLLYLSLAHAAMPCSLCVQRPVCLHGMASYHSLRPTHAKAELLCSFTCVLSCFFLTSHNERVCPLPFTLTTIRASVPCPSLPGACELGACAVTTLPVVELAAALSHKGFETIVSEDPGRYVCNVSGLH